MKNDATGWKRGEGVYSSSKWMAAERLDQLPKNKSVDKITDTDDADCNYGYSAPLYYAR